MVVTMCRTARLSGLAVVPLERQLRRVEIGWRLGFEETIQAPAMHQSASGKRLLLGRPRRFETRLAAPPCFKPASKRNSRMRGDIG